MDTIALILLALVLTSPAARAALPEDDNWEVMSSQLPGVDGRVDTFAQFGGKLYAGGRFRVIAGVVTTGIASWDGSKWAAVGSGVDGSVAALLARTNELIVAGVFTKAGNVAATNIARWDGVSWSPMPGLSTQAIEGVLTLEEFNGEIYAGGDFTVSGGAMADYIARWTQTGWQAVGGGVDGAVFALQKIGNILYTGGTFTKAGSLFAHGIARWDGLNWTPMDLGVHGPGQVPGKVYALAAIGINLYVGGDFSTAGLNPPVSSPGLARWFDDGATHTWNGVISGSPVSVTALRGSGDTLFVGGRFSSIGSAKSQNVGILAPGGWTTLGTGVSGTGLSDVAAFEWFSNELFVGGFFETAGGKPMQSLARWTGTDWIPVIPGRNLGMNAGGWRVNIVSNRVYVLSAALVAGGVSVRGNAEWTGGGWIPLTPGIPGWTQFQLPFTAADDGNLYASYIGQNVSRYLQRWDGTAWAPVGPIGPQGPVAVSGTNLYATGTFDGFGLGVAHLEDARWVGLGTNFYNGTNIAALTGIAAGGGVVYAAGNFTSVGDIPAPYVAKWDGAHWTALGNGPPIDPKFFASVAGITIRGENAYLGSTRNGGTNVLYWWNGSTWSTLPGTFKRSGAVIISAIEVDGDDLFVGGNFSSIDDLQVNNIARWDGTKWHALGSGAGTGPNDGVNSIAVSSNKVYITGSFTTAGGKPSSFFAIWHKPPGARPLAIQLNQSATGKYTLTWPAGTGTTVLEYSLAIRSISWLPVEDGIVTLDGFSSFPLPTSGPGAFYRLHVP
jgi:trimeric autotransporter adhesin